jgi:hypothetical protein
MQVLPSTGRWTSLHVDRPLNLYGLHDNVTAAVVLLGLIPRLTEARPAPRARHADRRGGPVRTTLRT